MLTWVAPWVPMQIRSLIASTAPNAQQDPHCPWSRMSVMLWQVPGMFKEKHFVSNFQITIVSFAGFIKQQL